ncbi:RPA family protein [Methanomicrobium sp. W14]|uniref:hypothetical protein n=1 Tax=Methanomicrobium sp. W14 TaxID=2817839 RepID=UPI001AE76D2A|nr:hypothetical protein [Methanomicrobium sp. W14]MBP2132246.1 RPA family protein [Methanomicrobium sp. W14]
MMQNQDPVLRFFAGELEFLEQEDDGLILLPTGQPVKTVYISGVLTEVKKGPGGYVSGARVADPSGVFIVKCGKDKGFCCSKFLKTGILSYVSVLGIIAYDKKESCFAVFPESVNKVSKSERNLWILAAADSTLKRLEEFRGTCNSLCHDGYTEKIIAVIENALKFVDTEKTGNDASGLKEDDSMHDCAKIVEIIRSGSTKKGIFSDDFYLACELLGISGESAQKCVEKLVEDGELYLPPGGYIKLI